MVTILKKEHTRLRVKEMTMPVNQSPILGLGIDVTAIPDGHLACVKCKGYKFECSIMGDFHRLECGCIGCGEAYRLLFPVDCPLPPQSGRFTCFKHKDKAMIVISNSGIICVGCESCKTEIRIRTRTESNIIIPEELH